MIFAGLKEFKPPHGSTPEEMFNMLTSYVEKELNLTLKELRAGLHGGLTFAHQFQSFESGDLSWTNGEEKSIRNHLGQVPTRWMISDAVSGKVGELSRGSTAWTKDLLYILNNGTGNITANLRFFA